MLRVTPAGVRPLVDRIDPHQPHQSAHTFAVHHFAVPSQYRHHATRPVKRRRQILLVQPPHQSQIIGTHRRSSVIQRRARNLQQPALRHDRQISVGPVDQRQPHYLVHGPDLLRKKSRSTVSSPIFSYSLASSARPPPRPRTLLPSLGRTANQPPRSASSSKHGSGSNAPHIGPIAPPQCRPRAPPPMPPSP